MSAVEYYGRAMLYIHVDMHEEIRLTTRVFQIAARTHLQALL